MACNPRRLLPQSTGCGNCACAVDSQADEAYIPPWTRNHKGEKCEHGTIWKWYNLEVRSSTIWKCTQPQWASVINLLNLTDTDCQGLVSPCRISSLSPRYLKLTRPRRRLYRSVWQRLHLFSEQQIFLATLF